MLPGLQEWIHKFEEGEGVRYIKLGLALLAILALTAVWHIREARNFMAVEAMDAAQLARNLAQGQGYTTKFIRPISVALVEKVRADGQSVLKTPHPDLANAPAYPVILAGLMRVLPFRWEIPATRFWRYQPEVLIGFFNQLLFFGAMFLVFKLGQSLFDSGVGWLAVVLFTATELFWEFATSGLSTMLLIVLVLLLAWCLVLVERHTRENTKSPRWFLLIAGAIGLLLGSAGLTRYSVGWLALPVIAFLAAFGGAHRVKLCIIPSVIILLLLAPWVYRNYAVSHHLFGIAGLNIYQGTEFFQGNLLERSLPSDLSTDLKKVAISDYFRKLALNLGQILAKELPQFAGNWIAGFFLVALLVPYINRGLSRFRFFIAGALLTLMIAQALGKTEYSNRSPVVNSENLLVLMAPLVFIFGAGLFFILLDQFDLPFPPLRRAAIITFGIALSTPFILRLLPPRNFPVNYPPYHPPLIQQISGWLSTNELMMTDMPWAAAWYGNRQCIWTTLDTGGKQGSDFFRISDYQKEIKGLYLTQITIDSKFLSDILKSEEGAWGRFVLESIIRTNIPTGFPLKKAPPGLFPDQLFLSDQKRWK